MPLDKCGLGYQLRPVSVNPGLDSLLQKSVSWSWTWKGFWFQFTALEVLGLGVPGPVEDLLTPSEVPDLGSDPQRFQVPAYFL